MKIPSYALLTLLIMVLSMYSPAEAALSQDCPLTQSIYRDGDGKGFELVFGPPPPKTVYDATAVIHHTQQRSLYRFTVDQLSGYGSVWLSDLSRSHSKQSKSFWMTFFDRDLKAATPLLLWDAKEAPQYVVIAELGSHDYYQRRGTENPPLIGDVMWKFDRCQPKQ